MKGLLDTHTFIWWDSDPARLSPQVYQLLLDRSNTILVSVVTIWEAVIKQAIGKLHLSRPLQSIIDEQEANGMRMLPILVEHVLRVADLPPVHRDPFDRLLVAQTQIEEAVLITADPVFARYPVRTLW
jgi:PIN domain nuclease of toxin-antitoxin system